MKLTTVEAAIVGEVLSLAAVLLSIGVISNSTDQLIVGLAVPIVANAGVIIAAIVNSIKAHTTAVVAAIQAQSAPKAKAARA